MASDIELFARLAADILKENKPSSQILPEGLNAEKAGEKSEPDETETPLETETEPPEVAEPTETKTETTTTTTTEKE